MFGLGLIELLIFVPAMFVVPASAFYLGLRWVRANERRAADHTESAALRDRVAQLEDALADTQAQLRRLTEANEFTTRLLEERGAKAASRAP